MRVKLARPYRPTKAYADRSQQKGGEVYRAEQKRLAARRAPARPAPRPSEHAVMRRKGIRGPAFGTQARRRYDAGRTAERLRAAARRGLFAAMARSATTGIHGNSEESGPEAARLKA